MQELGIIHNLKLEAYIPSTKQKPDIYFEIESEKYVIEFQCTPIASEFLKRRELYTLANIIDIWILGVNNYRIDMNTYTADRFGRLRKIEKLSGVHLDVNKERVAVRKNYVDKIYPHGLHSERDYYIYPLSYLLIDKLRKSIIVNEEERIEYNVT